MVSLSMTHCFFCSGKFHHLKLVAFPRRRGDCMCWKTGGGNNEEEAASAMWVHIMPSCVLMIRFVKIIVITKRQVRCRLTSWFHLWSSSSSSSGGKSVFLKLVLFFNNWVIWWRPLLILMLQETNKKTEANELSMDSVGGVFVVLIGDVSIIRVNNVLVQKDDMWPSHNLSDGGKPSKTIQKL